MLPIWEGTTNILVLDAVRASSKEGLHELLLDRIRAHEPARADRLSHAFNQLEERDARGWADRLATRPLGLAPGARP